MAYVNGHNVCDWCGAPGLYRFGNRAACKAHLADLNKMAVPRQVAIQKKSRLIELQQTDEERIAKAVANHKKGCPWRKRKSA